MGSEDVKVRSNFKKADSTDKKKKSKSRTPMKTKVPPAVLKAARAAARRQRAVAPPPGSKLTELELRTVTPTTRSAYENANQEFEQWAIINGYKAADFKKEAKLDEALVQYINKELFFRGEAVATARYVVYGTIFVRGLPKNKQTLPRARRALAGFSREDPATSEDPAPIEAVAILAHHFLQQPSLVEQLAGLATVVSFDLFTRPTETLEIRKEDIFAPKGRYKTTSVIIAPMPTKDKTLRAALLPVAKPAKSGQYDDTVIAGLPGLGLEWVDQLLRELQKQA